MTTHAEVIRFAAVALEATAKELGTSVGEGVAGLYEAAAELERLRGVERLARGVVSVIKAHDLESLSCDNDGCHYCECLDQAVTALSTATREAAEQAKEAERDRAVDKMTECGVEACRERDQRLTAATKLLEQAQQYLGAIRGAVDAGMSLADVRELADAALKGQPEAATPPQEPSKCQHNSLICADGGSVWICAKCGATGAAAKGA